MACLRTCSPIANSARNIRKQSSRKAQCLYQARKASTASATTTPESSEDVVDESSLNAPPPSPEQISSFDPIARARRRTKQLPPSRYQFRPPRYYRGPLHPHQPPPPSDPASRSFIPGPFTLPRLEETYHSTIAPDLLSLLYVHHPPGTLPGPIGQRLRTWDDSSPYHKGRPFRPPRGGNSLPLVKRNVTFRNLPRLDKIHVHAFLEESGRDGNLVMVAAMIVQAISGVRPTIYRGKANVQQFAWFKGMPCAVGVELRGEAMWHFLSKCVDVVMPRIRDWEGVRGTSVDGAGNVAWSFERDSVNKFPEVEVNYDSYPPKKIPRVNVVCCTTASTDRDARLLMSGLGVPFHGEHDD